AFITQSIRDHNINRVSLQVAKLTISNPVAFLINLSNLVRSLHLFQHEIDNINNHIEYFFGVQNFDCAPTIIEMFSGKLDSLHIENHYYPFYLSRHSADELPLLGKKIWFSATCNQYAMELTNSKNEHFV
ncbi:hypothetical protein PENTCL1PPCAC_19325, partial [Pristionchus entomophagus]